MSACRIRKPVGQNDFGFGSCEHRVSVGVGTSMVTTSLSLLSSANQACCMPITSR